MQRQSNVRNSNSQEIKLLYSKATATSSHRVVNYCKQRKENNTKLRKVRKKEGREVQGVKTLDIFTTSVSKSTSKKKK